MFSDNTSHIDDNTIELLENAQKRVRQKSNVYRHFIFFLFISGFILFVDLAFSVGENLIFFDYSWSIWIVLIWSFILFYHLFDVFVSKRIISKKWISAQKSHLIKVQQEKIRSLKKDIEKESKIYADSNSNNLNQMITIIAAASENDVIGNNNKLIWHLSKDLIRFKNLTKGHHVIMGRKTFESMPKALPNRTNVVITRNKNYTAENITVVDSLENALKVCKDDPQPFIIGGGEIYRIGLTYAKRIELTRVYHNFEGDTTFPQIDKNIWKEVKNIKMFDIENHNYNFSFITYDKIN
ncbi:MAG: dihydrofolate reductase [Flavobacteriales bacterium]|nr:dihydrofolate reductase [Flavobacteriales bacterium]